MASQLIPSFRFVLEIFKISTYIFEDFIYLWHISYPLGVWVLLNSGVGKQRIYLNVALFKIYSKNWFAVGQIYNEHIHYYMYLKMYKWISYCILLNIVYKIE